MAYRLRIGMLAQRHIDDFAVYLGDYSEPFAIEQIDRLNRILSVNIGEAPNTWSYFPFTGAPYRGICPLSWLGCFGHRRLVCCSATKIVCILALFARAPEAPATHKATAKMRKGANPCFHGNEW
jgi:hypothetical protein